MASSLAFLPSTFVKAKTHFLFGSLKSIGIQARGFVGIEAETLKTPNKTGPNKASGQSQARIITAGLLVS